MTTDFLFSVSFVVIFFVCRRRRPEIKFLVCRQESKSIISIWHAHATHRTDTLYRRIVASFIYIFISFTVLARTFDIYHIRFEIRRQRNAHTERVRDYHIRIAITLSICWSFSQCFFLFSLFLFDSVLEGFIAIIGMWSFCLMSMAFKLRCSSCQCSVCAVGRMPIPMNSSHIELKSMRMWKQAENIQFTASIAVI